ncbi:hypothetical protein [Pararobbsia alpina]|uniref:hypothetical protein n=1 Tax=Pararobbsia alpina TaxID=621374 RepID=UPI0039A53ECA
MLTKAIKRNSTTDIEQAKDAIESLAMARQLDRNAYASPFCFGHPVSFRSPFVDDFRPATGQWTGKGGPFV